MTPRSTLPALIAALACSATGCGPIERPRDTGPPRPRWITPAEAHAAAPLPPYGWSHMELAIVDLPQAGFPGADTMPPEWRRFIVNLQVDGSIYFKGHTWKPSRESFDALKIEFRKLARDLDPRFLMLDVRADRTTPWGTVRSLIVVGTTGEAAVSKLRFSLQARDARTGGNNAALDAVVQRAPPGVSEGALRLRLEKGAEDGVAITVRDRRLSFGPREALSDDPAALDVTNQTWDAVDAVLTPAAAGGVREARVEVADDVPWAYVAQTLSLLHEKGLTHVEILGLPVSLRLAAPPATAYLDFRRMFDHDWPMGFAIGAGLVLGIGAVVLPALRRRARSKPRPTSRPPAAA